MRQWTSAFDEEGRVCSTFRLECYSIVDGVPKFTLMTKGGATIIGGSTASGIIGTPITVRLYVPVELHRVPGIGLSPKMVYRMPRGYRIEEYKAAPDVAPHIAMAELARKHTISEL